MTWSQNNEEAVLLDLFKDIPNGRLLDIGAWSPGALSNSRALIDKGWSAVLVEPSPGPFKDLLDHYGHNPNVVLVNCAISPGPSGASRFYDSAGDAVSSMSLGHKVKWETQGGVKYRQFWLHPLPLLRLLVDFGMDFDFINLDVESVNLELFNALPLVNLTKARAICVEHDGHHEAMLKQAAPLGYKQVLFNGENIILAR